MKRVKLVGNGLVSNSFNDGAEYIKTSSGFRPVSELVFELEETENKLEETKREYLAEKASGGAFGNARLNSLNYKIGELMITVKRLTKELKKPTYRKEESKKAGIRYQYVKN